MAARIIGKTIHGAVIYQGTEAERQAMTDIVDAGARLFRQTDGSRWESDGTGGWTQTHAAGAALVSDGALATIIVTSGGITYIAEAVPGASATAAVWRAQSISSTGSVLWADGNGNFDNTPGAAGASLAGLSYS